MAEFAKIVEGGPDREVDGVGRWRRADLKRVIAERFGVDFHERLRGDAAETVGVFADERAPHSLHKTSGSSRLAKNFANVLSVHLHDLPAGTPIEIWFQDEARIGRKNGLVR